jgi:hypothetical protein
MKLIKYLILLILLQPSLAFAQTGIGTRIPDRSAVLDLSSTSKGLLMPRMSTTERNLIENPANALIIYNTTVQAIEFNSGTTLDPSWVLVGGKDDQGSSSITNMSIGAILVGSLKGEAQEVYVSGEVSLSHAGVASIDNDAVISKILTGYKIGSGKITASDNIIQAIQKLEGNQMGSKVTTTTVDYTVKLNDNIVICDNAMRSFTITLPEPTAFEGKIYVINKIDETYNKLNIQPPIQLTNRTTVSTLNYPKSFKIQSDGKVWYIIN